MSIRKAESQSPHPTGGMTTARREMLHQLREEEDELWTDYEYCDGEVGVLIIFFSIRILNTHS